MIIHAAREFEYDSGVNREPLENSQPLPPGDFVAAAVIVTVMGSAQGYRELVANLASHGGGAG
jgi:hypothetical protein